MSQNQGDIKVSVLGERPVPTLHPCLKRFRVRVQDTAVEDTIGSHGALQFKLRVAATVRNVSVRGSVRPFSLKQLKWPKLEECSSHGGLVGGLSPCLCVRGCVVREAQLSPWLWLWLWLWL
jgi:hypothetical protein